MAVVNQARAVDQAVLFGRNRSLVGVVSRSPQADGEALGVIILNTGIIHRVGHNRMYVLLARKLAELGHAVLRFDLSGLGDSQSPATDLTPLDAALADIRDAVDWLAASCKINRVVLVGLCSGADHSVIYAGSDPRVVGLVLMDPSIPPTPRFYVNYFGRRLLKLSNWLNFVSGRGRLWRLISGRNSRDKDAWAPQQLPLKDRAVRAFLENAYSKAVGQDNQMLAIFTAGLEYQHNYRGQILDAMRQVPFSGKLRLEYFARCDHTFTFEADRERLFETVIGWLSSTIFASPLAPDPKDDEIYAFEA